VGALLWRTHQPQHALRSPAIVLGYHMRSRLAQEKCLLGKRSELLLAQAEAPHLCVFEDRNIVWGSSNDIQAECRKIGGRGCCDQGVRQPGRRSHHIKTAAARGRGSLKETHLPSYGHCSTIPMSYGWHLRKTARVSPAYCVCVQLGRKRIMATPS